MRVPLKVTSYDTEVINIHISNLPGGGFRWVILDMLLAPAEEIEYSYTCDYNDENKFYENGHIYNANGSLASNTLLTRDFYFHGYRHVSLNKLVTLPEFNSPMYDVNVFMDRPVNYLYNLPAPYLSGLQNIVAVRERLNIPDWLAFLVFSEIVSEDSVCALLAEVPDLFSAYSYDWVLRILGVNEEKIHAFDNTQKGYGFQNFCKVIELEQQHISSELKTGAV